MPSAVYRLVRLLSDTALKIFFTKIEVVGKDNLPKHGPVILVGNHNNQFVDSMVVLWGVRRNVSFVIAEVSMHKPIVGPMAKALGAVPVVRPQDKAVPGTGKIVEIDYDAGTITGKGTKFTKDCAQKGCQVVVKGIDPFLVVEIISDTELTFKKRKPVEGEVAESGKAPLEAQGHDFKVIPKLDQKAVFESVHDLLAKEQGLLSIFPEGGSTDRTDLLPLKAGVSIMALGAAVKGADLRIVPYGINYMHGHAFRSKVFVEIGKPMTIDPELVAQYKSGQTRDACNVLMAEIEDSLRAVTINAPNYASLKIMRTARRMFQGSIKLDAKQYLELSRRFAKGEMIILVLLWTCIHTYIHTYTHTYFCNSIRWFVYSEYSLSEFDLLTVCSVFVCACDVLMVLLVVRRSVLHTHTYNPTSFYFALLYVVVRHVRL
jgi:glycerol-3-phosphate O-acyltransferase/dihydroxyacetone phosphate acyltransferase